MAKKRMPMYRIIDILRVILAHNLAKYQYLGKWAIKYSGHTADILRTYGGQCPPDIWRIYGGWSVDIR